MTIGVRSDQLWLLFGHSQVSTIEVVAWMCNYMHIELLVQILTNTLIESIKTTSIGKC